MKGLALVAALPMLIFGPTTSGSAVVVPDSLDSDTIRVEVDRETSGSFWNPPATQITTQQGDVLMTCPDIGPLIGDCVPYAPVTATPTPVSGVSPGLVESAVRRLGLPALRVSVQPAGRTLVNIPTIVYVNPVPFDRTVTLLGQSVAVRATPSQYLWEFGDGTHLTTRSPGHPYPNATITHTYQRTTATTAIQVTVTYHVTYQIGGGPARPLPSPITVTGPATTLRVDQARAVLVR